MDLYDVLRILETLPEKHAKFFAACLIQILAYLHEKGIAYRNLNPENIYIDDCGYPKITDFSSAKVL